jgi:hypothetical protein
VAATPRNVPHQGPGPFVGKLSSFETNNAAVPVACGNFGEVNKTRLLCVHSKRAAMCSDTSKQASWLPLLRVTSSGTVSSSPNGDEPCLLLLPVGLRPSSSAASPSSGPHWRLLLRLPNCRAIPLRRVSGTARHGIVSTLETQPRTNTTKRFDTYCGLLRLLAFSLGGGSLVQRLSAS